jgi:uncharacterized membrane protein
VTLRSLRTAGVRDLIPAQAGNEPQAVLGRTEHEAQAAVPAYADKWWRSAVVPAGLVALAFLAYTAPAYGRMDRTKSRIPLNPRFRWHYPALVAHIAFGAVALTATAPQMWTWLRVKHPRLHRRIGKVYVYGGVLPSAVLGLAITPFAGGPVGDGLEAAGWLFTTFKAQHLARNRDFAGHRRWMMYSYALCAQIVWGRILIITLSKTAPQWLEKNMGLVLETASWIGSVINLIAAQWWYEHTMKRPVAM